MFTVLGSLYCNELDLEPDQLVSTLATAALFQLDSMCDKCAEVMIETVDVEVSNNYLGFFHWGPEIAWKQSP